MLRGKARNSHDTIQYAISGWRAISLSMNDSDQLTTALASYARDDSKLCR
jgi:hypothetical protein